MKTIITLAILLTSGWAMAGSASPQQTFSQGLQSLSTSAGTPVFEAANRKGGKRVGGGKNGKGGKYVGGRKK
jgi:hypothetical protein